MVVRRTFKIGRLKVIVRHFGIFTHFTDLNFAGNVNFSPIFFNFHLYSNSNQLWWMRGHKVIMTLIRSDERHYDGRERKRGENLQKSQKQRRETIGVLHMNLFVLNLCWIECHPFAAKASYSNTIFSTCDKKSQKSRKKIGMLLC